MNDLSLVIDINRNDLVIMLLAVYTIVESFSAVCNMPEGYQMFCHKAKYAMAVVMSAAAIAFAFEHSPTYFNYMVLGMQIALTLFVWPRTVYRVKQHVAIFRDWPSTMITVEQLSKAVGCTLDRAAKWYPHLVKAMQQFGINSVNEMASFISQLAHESGHLSRLEENLNYSADNLARVWPGRYRDPISKKPNRLALMLHRRPIAIANNCYANRMGNGNEGSGDGFKYRGRGPIQITGRDMYFRCGQALGIDLIANPELLLQPEYGAMSAGWFWQLKELDKHDDDTSALAETKLINGGTTGIDDRERLLKLALIEFSQGA